MTDIREEISFLGQELVSEILDTCKVCDFEKGTEILREGQYVKVLPIVIEGLVKVYSSFNERELLLYYIQPQQSCIMSFSSSFNNEPSKVFAKTEEDSKVLLLPVDKVSVWLKKYPNINALFYQQYNLRYTELLDTISHVLFDKMDKRLYDYLLEKAKMTKQNPIKISHRQIANELGTAREVITRVMKKLESEQKVKQLSNGIKMIG